MRTNSTIACTIAMLATFTAGCADAPTATGPEPLLGARKPTCGTTNTGLTACSSLTGSIRASASFIEHEVQGTSGTSYTSYAQPTAAYLQGTTKVDFTSLIDGDYYSSITDGTQTVSFPNGQLQKRSVPASWLTWSSPPESESATPAVLHSTSTTFTALTFSQPVAVVGFELEGNLIGPIEFMAEYYDDTYKLLGIVRRTVESTAGARLFSFSTDWSKKISQVDISAGGEAFALAQVRYSLNPLPDAPPAATPVTIDIKPGTTPNDVQRSSKGLLPVAVLTTSNFNAATVDVASVTLGNEIGTDTRIAKQNKKTPMAAMQDVDLDGDLDLILQFEIPTLVANGDLTASTTQLVLKGTRTGGGAVRGVDNVVVKP